MRSLEERLVLGNRKQEQPDLEEMAQLIRERAGNYFSSPHTPRIHTHRTSRGWNATVCFFQLEFPDRPNQRRGVAVKVFHRRRRAGASTKAPRVFDPDPSPSPSAREHAALVRIESGFTRLGDPRFGVVRVLDLLTDIDALVMETHSGRGLDADLARSAGGRRHQQTLTRACARTGAWLKAYHELPPMEGTLTTHTRRSDFVDAVGRIGLYLVSTGSTAGAARELSEAILKAAQEHHPSELAPSTLHGDFVPRNVLISADEAVTGFDTRAPWLAPREYDVARFLLALKIRRKQSLLRRPARLMPLEDGFLTSYYGDQVPIARVRLYEALALLEAWALVAHRVQSSQGIRRAAKRARLSALSPFYARRLAEMVSEVR